uniref:Ubiquitin carrier protein 7 n=2 Tax=Zea mays TaxID=4577 RepID=A0A804MNF2_MAIZE
MCPHIRAPPSPIHRAIAAQEPAPPPRHHREPAPPPPGARAVTATGPRRRRAAVSGLRHRERAASPPRLTSSALTAPARPPRAPTRLPHSRRHGRVRTLEASTEIDVCPGRNPRGSPHETAARSWSSASDDGYDYLANLRELCPPPSPPPAAGDPWPCSSRGAGPRASASAWSSSLSDGSEQRSAMRCGVARLPRAPRRWRGKGRTRARARERIAVDGLVRGTLGDPGAWFLGSTAFAAVGFAEPEPTEMTVDELKLQARASGGHDLRTSSPSACACSPSTTTRPASRSSRTSCSAASTM